MLKSNYCRFRLFIYEQWNSIATFAFIRCNWVSMMELVVNSSHENHLFLSFASFQLFNCCDCYLRAAMLLTHHFNRMLMNRHKIYCKKSRLFTSHFSFEMLSLIYQNSNGFFLSHQRNTRPMHSNFVLSSFGNGFPYEYVIWTITVYVNKTLQQH